jgi:hypothetical protein
MPLLKGINITHTRAFIEAELGLEGWASVAAETSPSMRDGIDGAVAVGWYPTALHVELLRAMEVALEPRRPNVVARASAFSADYDMTRIHRLLFRALDPGLLLEKSTEIWGRFYDTGKWTFERPSKTSAIGTLADFAIVDERYCRYLTGYFQRMFDQIGAKEARMRHPRCRGRGDKTCRFEADWR